MTKRKITGRIIAIVSMQQADILTIEYRENGNRYCCYGMQDHKIKTSARVGDTVLFEEALDSLGPLAVNLSIAE